MPSSIIDPKGGDFKRALTKLANDPGYRIAATADPKRVTTDFKLNTKELFALREAAALSGADLQAVNTVIRDIKLAKSGAPGSNVVAPLAQEVDIDIDCCCCCCCCCGEAAVAPLN